MTEKVIRHYGVKGMHWGVRRYRSTGSKVGAITKKLLVGNEKTSLATARGRRDFKKNVKADITSGKKLLNKILKDKTFKTLIYNHENFMKLVKKGKDFNKKRKISAAEAARKDAESLEKAGYKKEAAALRANARVLEKGK